jgi:AP-1-like factor
MANFFSQSSLSQEQQDVLIAALNTNRQDQTTDAQPPSSTSFDFASGSLSNPMFAGFSQPELNGGFSEQQFLDYLGSNNNFDYNSIAPEDTVDDPTSPTLYDDDNDLHDKRKNSTDDEDNGTAKRREGEEKIAKKPGRKPLTTEPTSVSLSRNSLKSSSFPNTVKKRKAQNRAAQRAFRDRKERHLKELETKMDELEKSSESINHENGLLRAQVEKLTSELKEYRKRLSSSSSVRPPPTALRSFSSSSSGPVGPNWNFDYPQFGLNNTYTPLYNNRLSQASVSPSEGFDTGFMRSFSSTKASERSGSNSQGATPALSDFIKSPTGSTSADSPQTNGSSISSTSQIYKPLDHSVGHPPADSPKSYNIFTSTQVSSPQTANLENLGSDNSSAPRVFKFSPNTPASSSGSPSSFAGPSSSCGTSPEPSGPMGSSAKELEPISENQAMATDANTLSLFGASSGGEGFDFSAFTGNQGKDPCAPDSWMDVDNTNAFFGGDAMFSGFSEDSSSTAMDMFAPMNWNDLAGNVNIQTGLTPAIQKPDPMELIEADGIPRPDFIPCHKIW